MNDTFLLVRFPEDVLVSRDDAIRTDIVKVGGCGSKKCKQNENGSLSGNGMKPTATREIPSGMTEGHNAQRHSSFVIPQMSDLVLIPAKREDEN